MRKWAAMDRSPVFAVLSAFSVAFNSGRALVNRQRLFRERKLLVERFGISDKGDRNTVAGGNVQRRCFQVRIGRRVGVDVVTALDCDSNNCVRGSCLKGSRQVALLP